MNDSLIVAATGWQVGSWCLLYAIELVVLLVSPT